MDWAQTLAGWGMDEMEIYAEVYIYGIHRDIYMVYAGNMWSGRNVCGVKFL